MQGRARRETRASGIAGVPVQLGMDEYDVQRHEIRNPPLLYSGGMRRLVLAAAIALAFVGARSRVVHPSAPPPAVSGPTYSNEIARIFQDRCQTCHHDGDIAPFSLTNYADAKANAQMIKVMTQTHQMPPWKPTPDCGDFADARVMPQSEIDLIAKWVNNGAPQGDPSQLPPPLDFSGGWSLGQPD